MRKTNAMAAEGARRRAMSDSSATGKRAGPGDMRGRATSVGKVTNRIAALQTIAAEVLEEQHSEADDISTMIARLGENDASLATFELKNAATIQRLDTKARNAVFKTIVDAFRRNTHVHTVVLANLNGTDYLAEEMADAMATNTTVSTLNLESNMIKHEGVIALAAMLRQNSTLEKLRLGNQAAAITTKALHALADALGTGNTTLTACNVKAHDATAREKLEKALFRNMDSRRVARNSVSKERPSLPPQHKTGPKPPCVASSGTGAAPRGADNARTRAYLDNVAATAAAVSAGSSARSCQVGGARGSHSHGGEDGDGDEDEDEALFAAAAEELEGNPLDVRGRFGGCCCCSCGGGGACAAALACSLAGGSGTGPPLSDMPHLPCAPVCLTGAGGAAGCHPRGHSWL